MPETVTAVLKDVDGNPSSKRVGMFWAMLVFTICVVGGQFTPWKADPYFATLLIGFAGACMGFAWAEPLVRGAKQPEPK